MSHFEYFATRLSQKPKIVEESIGPYFCEAYDNRSIKNFEKWFRKGKALAKKAGYLRTWIEASEKADESGLFKCRIYLMGKRRETSKEVMKRIASEAFRLNIEVRGNENLSEFLQTEKGKKIKQCINKILSGVKKLK